MLKDFYLTDGLKVVNLNQFPKEAWTFIRGQADQDGDLEELYKKVPWLYRGVHLRSTALSSVPFVILRGEDEIDTSDNYENKVGFLPNPRHLLYMVEAALTVFGAAYLLPERNRVRTLTLRWILPTSITPKFDKQKGLAGFIRSLGSDEIAFEPDELVHFWLPDPFKELGPGSSPAAAALSAAGALRAMDEFIDHHITRGLVKATILAVEGNPPREEIDRLETFFKRTIMGLKNAARVIGVKSSVEPKVIGEGFAELSDITLSQEKREDISAALGIPNSMLFSNAANFATAQQDELNFYNQTVLPEADLVADVLNMQLFGRQSGQRLRWEFRPQQLSIFQEDEEQRAESLLNLVNAGLDLSVALELLGFELTDDQLERLFPPEPEEPQLPPPGEPIPVGEPFAVAAKRNGDGRLYRDLDKWERKAINKFKKGEPPAVPFESDLIPATLNAAILGALETAEDEDDVAAVFDGIWYP